MSSGEPKISIQNVSKIFGSAPKQALPLVSSEKTREQIKAETGQLLALRDISLSVAQGEIFVMMGLSGSGKSTLLRCVNRLHEITSGSIRVNNIDVMSLTDEQLRRLRRTTFGMVFQHFALFPTRTVLENTVFGLEIQGVAKTAREAKGRDVLATVGLEQWADNLTNELSGGMQQRVGLARALAVDPEILLMDEPFSALDPLIRNDLQEQLLKLHHEMKKTILFVTHDLNEAIRIGDRIAILNSEGRVVQVGEPEEIILSPADEYVERFLGDVDRPSVIRVERVMREAPKEQTIPNERRIHRLRPIKEVLGRVLEQDEPVGVTNDNGELVGAVTRDDVIRILHKNL